MNAPRPFLALLLALAAGSALLEGSDRAGGPRERAPASGGAAGGEGAPEEEEAPAARENGSPGRAKEPSRRDLDAWAYEPVSLQGASLRVHVDRRDSSFFLQDPRSTERFFSSWERRGYASLRLADGRILPVDRAEPLAVTGERFRFRGASSRGALPPVLFEIAADRASGAVTFRFEVPDESRDSVTAVLLLDRALWVPDRTGGGVAVPYATGRRLAADGTTPEEIVLRGAPQLDASLIDPGPRTDGGDASGAGTSPRRDASPPPWSLPVAGLEKGDLALLLYWDRLGASLRVERRPVDDPEFPGRGGTFLSLEFPGDEGELHLAGGTVAPKGLVDIGRVYRSVHAAEIREASLRYKTGFDASLRPLLGGVILRAALAGSPVPPDRAGTAYRSFDEAAALAARLREELEIEDAVFILEDWLGSGGGKGEPLFRAAEECGGDEGLAECARRVREAGWVFGLALDRDQLFPDPRAARPRGEAAWRRAEAAARSERGFAELAKVAAPRLLVVREPRGEIRDREALEPRRRVVALAEESFSLWGTNLLSELDISAAALFESFLPSGETAGDLPPAPGDDYPLFSAVYGQHARLALPPGRGLLPGDAPLVLRHLLVGEAPAFDYRAEGEPEGAATPGSSPRACFAREGGWTAGRGLSPREVFLKNVYELCAPVAAFAAREPLSSYRVLEGGDVIESRLGTDLRIVVNLGSSPWEDEDGDFLLPPYGFVVHYPFFHAFHALRAGGIDYEEPAFFTVRSLEGKMYLRAERTRIYHGFGPATIRLGGRDFTVEREAAVKIW